MRMRVSVKRQQLFILLNITYGLINIILLVSEVVKWQTIFQTFILIVMLLSVLNLFKIMTLSKNY